MTTAALEWRVNPWRERPRAAATAAAGGLGACVLVVSLGEATLLSAALCLAVLGALSPLLSPAECRVDDEGVSRRGPFGHERRAWRELRRAHAAPDGLLVSPYAASHWLDATRGLVLPLPRGDREALLAGIAPHLERHGLRI